MQSKPSASPPAPQQDAPAPPPAPQGDASVHVTLRGLSTQELLEELKRRGEHLAGTGAKQAGNTITNRAQYLLDHMPGKVLLYTPAKDEGR
jgi:hypothetical protein